jgi:hypothetical protein
MLTREESCSPASGRERPGRVASPLSAFDCAHTRPYPPKFVRALDENLVLRRDKPGKTRLIT